MDKMPTKKQWGDGPWQHEPDELEWLDEASGYKCRVQRGPVGALCGYVGVPATHPAHGLHYDGCTWAEAEERSRLFKAELTRTRGNLKNWRPLPSELYKSFPGIGEAIEKIEVHGGLTYANGDEEIWWFGFDCAHAGDLMPQSDALMHRIYIDMGETKTWEKLRHMRDTGPAAYRDTYKTIDYVRQECLDLAKQLKALEVSIDVKSYNSSDRTD